VPHTLHVVSDIHYGCEAERRRGDYEVLAIPQPGRRLAVKLYRHFIWMRHPFAHNHLVDRFCDAARAADLVVANGDYSCDSAFIGVSDDAACQSARECLAKLRAAFGDRLHATLGDHELGKLALAGGQGGLRLASWHRATGELALQPFWRRDLGSFTLLGVTSTLLALPIYERESLPAEWPDWQRLRAEHLDQINATFAALEKDRRLILFCHDPTALPFLAGLEPVRQRLGQIALTIIGHLHTNLVYHPSQWLAGFPPVHWLGPSIRRYTTALNQARAWRPFRVRLCPALAGIELFKEGGHLSLHLDDNDRQPVTVRHHRLPRRAA
jgi:hypothetical protein